MHDFGDLSLFTIGGGSFLGDVRRVGYDLNLEYNETQSINSKGKRRQRSQNSAAISIDAFSTTGAGLRVDYMNVTALLVGGLDLRCDMYSFSVKGSYEKGEEPKFCGIWKKPYNGDKDYDINVDVGLEGTAAREIIERGHSDLPADREVLFQATINGVQTIIPAVIGNLGQAFEYGELQRLPIQLLGNAPLNPATAYPASPLGTTTLLEWFLNDHKTTRAFELVTHDTEGLDYHGLLLPGSFEFGCNQNEVLMSKFTLDSYGEVVPTPTAL